MNTFHAWLHVPDYLEQSGPLTSFWCWICERYCGLYARSISSRKHPYASLNRRALELQTLQVIINKYDLQGALPVYTDMHESADMPTFTHPEYPDITLLHPRRVLNFVADKLDSLKTRVAAHLVTRFGKDADYFKSVMPTTIEQWGRINLATDDRINSWITTAATEANRRDATFIEYELFVDMLAHRRRARPVFRPRPFFGRVERIFVLHLRACPDVVDLKKPTSYIFLDVHQVKAVEDRFHLWNFAAFGGHEVIDAETVRSLVGRIYDRGKWTFIRRYGVATNLLHPTGEGLD